MYTSRGGGGAHFVYPLAAAPNSAVKKHADLEAMKRTQ